MSPGKKVAKKKSTGKVATKRPVAKAGARRKAAKAATAPKSAGAKTVSAKTVSAKPEAKAYRLNVGDVAPSFRLPATGGGEVSGADLRGRLAVIYFYPKDNTPGCTVEGQDFRRLHGEFRKAGAEVYGVSADSLKSHDGFKAKQGFPFELLSDADGKTARAFDVMQMKSMYGRTFEGIERSTFVIDRSGRVRAVWRKLKVAGHADEVLRAVKGLK